MFHLMFVYYEISVKHIYIYTNTYIISTGEGNDRPSLSPILVAYVCISIYVYMFDRNFIINCINLMFVHYTFSSVLTPEWPPFGK